MPRLGDGRFVAAAHHEGAGVSIRGFHDWLLGHARPLMAYTALILGAYLTISALGEVDRMRGKPQQGHGPVGADTARGLNEHVLDSGRRRHRH